jgi:hypothetical protein
MCSVALVDNDVHEDGVRHVKGLEPVDKCSIGELQVVGHLMLVADVSLELLEAVSVWIWTRPGPPTRSSRQFVELTEALAVGLGDSWTKWDALPKGHQAGAPNSWPGATPW